MHLKIHSRGCGYSSVVEHLTADYYFCDLTTDLSNAYLSDNECLFRVVIKHWHI